MSSGYSNLVEKPWWSITVGVMTTRVKWLARYVGGGRGNKLEPPLRLSSFPFLSGDTFRAMAGVVWESGEVKNQTEVLRNVLFFEASAPLESDHLGAVVDRQIERTPKDSLVVIIHNGDTPPDRNALLRLGKKVKKVYCVNVLDDIDGVTPIPIGLENAWHNKNGRLRYYLDRPSRSPEPENFDHLVLSSFSVGTNREKREPVAALMKSSRHGHHGMAWKSGEFRDVISRSLFVISPPGNGADTHRTWEAIYLGAVPVVAKGSLASSLTDNLPILAVDDYEEFVDMSDDDLMQTYIDMRQRPTDKAYAPYWASELAGNPGVSFD